MRDTKQLVTQPERNSNLRRIILDLYSDKCATIAGTEQLIIEYCISRKTK